MKMTSAEANKLMRKLYEEHDAVWNAERARRIFVAATVEDPDEVRPDYDYAETQKKLAELEDRIGRLKHALNLFNVSQEVPGFGMTIDRMLVYLPQLKARKEKLAEMRQLPVKARKATTQGSTLIEYTYANFDVSQADRDYNEAADELARAQNALDLVNSTVPFEVEL